MSLILFEDRFDVGGPRKIKWAMVGNVTTEITTSWALTAAVQQVQLFSWQLWGRVAAALSYSWSVFGLVSRSLDYSWEFYSILSGKARRTFMAAKQGIHLMSKGRRR